MQSSLKFYQQKMYNSPPPPSSTRYTWWKRLIWVPLKTLWKFDETFVIRMFKLFTELCSYVICIPLLLIPKSMTWKQNYMRNDRQLHKKAFLLPLLWSLHQLNNYKLLLEHVFHSFWYQPFYIQLIWFLLCCPLITENLANQFMFFSWNSCKLSSSLDWQLVWKDGGGSLETF